MDLRAARIIDVKRHPDAEKLYIETIDLGTEQRTIVSGLVPHYKEEELNGHMIVLVSNLKPALLRGVESKGMLLAASEGKTVEVLFVDHAKPGDRVVLAGGPAAEAPAEIDIDMFFSMPITAEDRRVVVGNAALECAGKPVETTRVVKGRVKQMSPVARDAVPGATEAAVSQMSSAATGQMPSGVITVRSVPLARLDESSEMLPSGFWGSFKEGQGWKAVPFEVTTGGTTVPLLVLTRRLARLFSIAYVPFGPSLDPLVGRGTLLAVIAQAVRSSLPKGTLFLRFDLPWPRTGESPDGGGRGMPRVRKCSSDMQPPSTVIVDITGTAEDVLASMKPKTRYNVRLAQKKGVTVTEGGVEDLDRWYAMYEETARREQDRHPCPLLLPRSPRFFTVLPRRRTARDASPGMA